MQLMHVYIETLEGASYSFPDMDKEKLEQLLGNDSTWKALGSLVLVNASGACLVVPTRIIKTIALNPDFVDALWTASVA